MIDISLGDLCIRHAERKPPGAAAVVYPDITLTWHDLARRATQRARQLRALSVMQDDRVVVAVPNSAAFHEVCCAIWKIGATPCIVSHRLPLHEFQAMMVLLEPRLIVGASEALAAGRARIDVDSGLDAFDATPFEGKVATHWKAMGTGGSTGRPKVIVDHAPGRLDGWQDDFRVMLSIRPDSVVLNPGPLSHNAPFLFAHLALFCGCELIGMGRFDAEETLRLIERHRVTWVNFAPTMMHRIWSLPRAVRERYDLSSLQTVWHMAAPCAAWLKQAWIDWLGAERIWELYGGTERYGATILRGDEWLAKRGSVGRIVGDSRIKAIRDDGTDCYADEVGELYFSLADPNVLPSHYIGAEPRRTPEGWYSLGDIGHVDADGYVFLADRRTDLILRGGANVYPAEVEAALEQHPDVAACVVVGLPCEEMGQRVHAIVQPKPGALLGVPELATFLEQRLTRYKQPESYELIDVVLRDEAGKVRRSALRDERVAWLLERRAWPEYQPVQRS
jgi:bile acid-coenzyme A ligase